MRLKSKPWAKPLISEHPELIQTDQDPIVLKTGFQHYALEIGTGKGDFIAGKSLQQPQTFFYGIERVTTVVAFALKKVRFQDFSYYTSGNTGTRRTCRKLELQ